MFTTSLKLVLLLLLLSFAACQSKNEKSGKTIYFNIGGEPTTLSPLSSSDGYSSSVHGYIFEGLLDRDPDTHEWKPSLATAWSVSSDKKEFEFTLREGVKWHDGKEFSAEDVKYSYDVIFTDAYKAVQVRSYFEAIKEVQILDKYKVKFILKDDYFGNFEVCAGMTILPKHYYSDEKNKKLFGKNLVGTGPYKLTKYDKGQKIILIKNPTWWGLNEKSEADSFVIPKVVLRFSSEENVTLELLKKGNIDFMVLRPEGYIKKTVGKVWDDKIIKVKTENKTPKGYNFIGFNFKHPVLKDRQVRKALSMLFNRPLMQDKFEYNLSDQATGPIYTQSDYANPNTKPVPYDPQGALGILNAAGWKDSDKDGILEKMINGKKTKLSFTILEPTEVMMKYLTVFKEDASKAGVEVNIKNVEWNSFVKLLDEKNFDAVRLAWGGGSVDIDLKQIWHSSSSIGSGSNIISYSNKVVDGLIDQYRKIYKKEGRVPLLQKAHQLIADDYPYIFFFNSKYTLYATTKRIVRPKDTFKYSLGQQYWTIK